jgi:hypothetical protein
MAARKKKTANKKKAIKSNDDEPSSHALMAPVPDALWEDFAVFRKQRKENRAFPWTVRDCVEIMLTDYLEKYGE